MATHLAIEAENPQQMARFFANLWDGEVRQDGGACLALRPDGRSIVAVEPHSDHPDHHVAPYIAISTHLNADGVMAICRAEGRPAKMCQRGDHFGVIEVADRYTVATIFTAR